VSIRQPTYRAVEVRLGRSDLEGTLDLLREAGELDGTELFPSELLSKLAALVCCESATYAEIDRVRFERTFAAGAPADAGADGSEEAAYWATVHEHPIRQHRIRTGELGAFKIYDFVSARQLRRTQFYTDFVRPVTPGGFVMSVCLPAPRGYTRTFNFERGRADFGERERTLLDLLQPHLLQLRITTEVRHRARASAQALLDGVLTERETEVLYRVAEGMRNREIAEALWIAPGTVRKHLDNIYAKLGVHGRAAATARIRKDPSAT
jgi:DNA-binding CsgD family transcriptional regulator